MAILDPLSGSFGAGLAIGAGAVIVGAWVAPAAVAAARPVVRTAIGTGVSAFETSRRLGTEIIEGTRDLGVRAYRLSREGFGALEASVRGLLGGGAASPAPARRRSPARRKTAPSRSRAKAGKTPRHAA